MANFLKSWKKRYFLIVLGLIPLVVLFRPADSHEKKLGQISTTTPTTSVFHYKVPALGSLSFILASIDGAENSAITAQLREQRRNICNSYRASDPSDISRYYICSKALTVGTHKSRLFDTQTQKLLAQTDSPHGGSGFTLMTINGLPKSRTVRLEVDNLAFDASDNTLIKAIRNTAGQAIPEPETTMQVVARLKRWTADIHPPVSPGVEDL